MFGNMLRTVLFAAALLGAVQIGGALAKFEKVTSLGSASVALAAPFAPGGVSSNGGGGCGGGSGGSGGCNMGSSGSTNPAALKDAESAAIAYYKSSGGTGSVTASAKDFGCHVQVDILENGKVVDSYSYRGGQIAPNL